MILKLKSILEKCELDFFKVTKFVLSIGLKEHILVMILAHDFLTLYQLELQFNCKKLSN